MFGESFYGFIGNSGYFNALNMEIDANIPVALYILFHTVFAGTAATIVSGAVAERTKFKAYLLFSVAVTTLIYPVVGHWVWGSGWLKSFGFHDFAGSTVVHAVGGLVAVVGASMVGPRIGKYGKNGKVNYVAGHSLTLGSLGVFILWLGWVWI
jgi:ammonium transporter, Amt family